MPDGIRINAIAPGVIKTKMAELIVAQNPAAVGTPDQIGAVAATICAKKDGGFMNGEVFIVNGGFSKL